MVVHARVQVVVVAFARAKWKHGATQDHYEKWLRNVYPQINNGELSTLGFAGASGMAHQKWICCHETKVLGCTQAWSLGYVSEVV
jgi:hypothetical protein